MTRGLRRFSPEPAAAGGLPKHAIRNALARLMFKVEEIHDAVPPNDVALAQAVASLLDEIDGISELLDSGA